MDPPTFLEVRHPLASRRLPLPPRAPTQASAGEVDLPRRAAGSLAPPGGRGRGAWCTWPPICQTADGPAGTRWLAVVTPLHWLILPRVQPSLEPKE